MSRKRPSASWPHSSDDNSPGLPQTTALGPRKISLEDRFDLPIDATADLPRPMNIQQSDAMTSNVNTSNGFLADFEVPKTQPILTKALIKADVTCMKSNHIVSLLEYIWEYSSTHAFLPITHMEVTAGHRYWLPENLLAEEWMMFFIFVPRLLDYAPREVRTAFEEQVYNVLGKWPSFLEITRKGIYNFKSLGRFPLGQLARQPFQHGLYSLNPHEHVEFAMPSLPRSLANRETPYMAVTKDPSSTAIQDIGYSQSKRPRLGDMETARLITDPLPVMSSGPDTRLVPQSFAALAGLPVLPSSRSTVVVPHLLPPAQPTRHVPQGHMQLAHASIPSALPGSSSVPMVSVFPLQSVPSGAAAFAQNPAAPPIFDQLLQARGITVPGFRPGSVLPTDNGNKAWSAERIRAFVQIQHNSIHQLPPTAFSLLGTEMSNFRTPESIDVTNCPFETSLEENFTYLSNVCTLNREMCFRARQHWLPMHIARYINYAHDIQTSGIFGRSKIGHHFAKAKVWAEARPGHVPTAALRHTSTDSGARGPNKVLHDYFLHSMGDGVVRPPHGRRAQMLTRVIEHVRNVTGDRNVRLSEAATYAQRHSITVPMHEQMDFQNLAVEDRLPSVAFLDLIKADYRNKFNGEDP